ncbi:alpha/beta hydrolase [Carpediemonas membranifera]|uniref:Alpha/beta hydrolase n=1 Tax=Carpediemonas membranifera TaxID=201153 RepID=A0A8J6B8L2_9EUKA|nr:alpha/beta hydrolase [Carpediemonas membranifera]|eukprot:KAG9394982.1 alpha/beta hydrolase [Carpediemonas membranifera]
MEYDPIAGSDDPFLELDQAPVVKKRRFKIPKPSLTHVIYALYVVMSLISSIYVFFGIVFQYYTEAATVSLIVAQLVFLSYTEIRHHFSSLPLTLVLPYPLFTGFLMLYNAISGFIVLTNVFVEHEFIRKIYIVVCSIPNTLMAILEFRTFVMLCIVTVKAYAQSRRKQHKKPFRETGKEKAQRKNRLKAGDTDAQAILDMSSLANYSMAEDLERLLSESQLKTEEVRQMKREHMKHVRYQLLRDTLRSSYLLGTLTPMLFFVLVCLTLMLQNVLVTWDQLNYGHPGFYTTSEGRTLHVYCSIGPDLPHDDPTKQGHLIMLDAGYGLPGMVWYRAVLDLAAEMDEPLTICYYDKPGLGWSTLPMFYRPTAADYVTTLHDAIKAALANDPQTVNPRSSVTLVSHGTAALYMPEFVAKHPDLVDHVVTVDGYSANMTGQVDDTIKPFTSRVVAMLAPFGMGRLWAHSLGAPHRFASSEADAWVALNSRTTQWIAQMAEAEDIGSLLASNKKYAKPGVLGGIPLSVIVADMSESLSAKLWTRRREHSEAMLAWSCAAEQDIITMKSGHRMMIDIPMKIASSVLNAMGKQQGSCDIV